MKRAAGILLPVFSLPGDFGIGSFSIEAYRWIDCLKEAGQSYWQILPLGPTGYGDSPYQSFSSFAGNPYFIDLEELKALGLLTEEELSGERHCGDEGKIDYGHIYESREKLLRLAHRRFRESLNGIESVGEDAVRRTKDRATYQAAVAALHPETGEYCLYRAVKDSQGGKSYLEWEAPLKERDSEVLRAFAASHEAEIDYYVWTQVLFHEQWSRLKEYALAHGITIIGDLPIYVAPDSADAWAHPELFQLDEEGKPDELVSAQLANADDDLLLVSRDGQAVRFAATDEQLRPMGRSTSGVRGMKFRGDDELLTMDVPREGTDLLIVTDSGYAKRTPIEEYPTKGRGTMGVRVGRLVEERGGLVGALVVDPEEDIMVITESGKLVQVNASDVRPTARNTMGVIFARPDENDRIIAVTRNPERDIDEEESEDAQTQDNSSQSNDETPAEDVASEHDDSQEVQE